MPKISLNSFIDYFVAQTASKPARVRAAKKMMTAPTKNYAAMDYWLPLRKAAESALIAGGDKALLDACLKQITDSKKKENYSECVGQLKKWIGRQTLTASKINSKVWSSGSLEVTVTPEVLLSVNGGPPVVLKLWFKSDPLSKYAASPMLRMMEHTHGSVGEVAILDVRRRKLIQGPIAKPSDMDLVLDSEAVAYAQLWKSL